MKNAESLRLPDRKKEEGTRAKKVDESIAREGKLRKEVELFWEAHMELPGGAWFSCVTRLHLLIESPASFTFSGVHFTLPLARVRRLYSAT